jgi:hypothetical protein
MSAHGCRRFMGLAAMLLLATGCHRPAADEHDHLEHHKPPHKPGSLPVAVVALEVRFAALQAASKFQTEGEIARLRQFVEIVRWLPDIAGDSDLPEAEWNVVHDVSSELAPPFADQLRRAERGQGVDLAPLAEPFGNQLTRLRAVAQHESLLPPPAPARVAEAKSERGDEP